jgi:glycosyltransferase involved in cell wall biosynthesis
MIENGHSRGGDQSAGPSAVGGSRTRGVVKRGTADAPLVSVLTVVLNGAAHIRECIESVLDQTYPNVEYVVIDGGSTDGTLDIIREYDDRITYWQSGRDKGIYDAMNQGLQHVAGSIIGIVGSDDALYPDAAESVVAAFVASPQVAYTYGAVDLVRPSGEIFGSTLPIEQAVFEKDPYEDMPFNHLSLFVRAEVYETVGHFDTTYPVRADWDFVLRMLSHGYAGVRLDTVIGRYRAGGTSDAIDTCFETRRLMLAHNVPWLRIERRFLSSLVKFWVVSALPARVVRRLTRLKRSRHVFH